MSTNPERAKKVLTDNAMFLYSHQFEVSKAVVKNSNFSNVKYKNLTLDIMDEVKSNGDVSTMNVIASIVARWSKKEVTWVTEITNFCKQTSDICEFIVGLNAGEKDILLLVDDTTKEEVLDYNEFMFGIRSRYDEVHDFMIIDDSMKSVINAMYADTESIYVRG